MVQLINISPEKIEIAHSIGSINEDGQIKEEMICGKCGGPAKFIDIPKSMLEISESMKIFK